MLTINLPINAVYDIKIHPREKDVIIGMHGRGVFITNLNDMQKDKKKENKTKKGK